MRSTENFVKALPTGRWLVQQRELFSMTVSELAKALHRHPSTVRAIERNNRVIPPGWGDGLRLIGMQLPAPAWPGNMPAYFGAELEHDMNTRAGLRHSRFWLSKQLCVPEKVVVAVIHGNLVVPHDWLLKLAELGANVPAAVRRALDQTDRDSPSPACESAPLDFSELISKLPADGWRGGPRATGPEAQEPTGSLFCEPSSDDSKKRLPADEPPPQRKPQSLYIHWTEEGGLHVTVSTALLDQIPVALQELLLTLYPSSLPTPSPSPLAKKAAGPSRG